METKKITIPVTKKLFWQLGFQFTLGAINAFGLCFVIGFIIMALVWPTDETDTSRWNRSGVSIFTDKKTGIEYFISGGAITPRLGVEGNKI